MIKTSDNGIFTRDIFFENLSTAMDPQISIQEIRRVVANLKNKKAVALDNITNEIIKVTFEVVPEVFRRLFNHIYMSGVYPNIWSSGIIKTIHKKGPTTEPENYRGITVGSCLAKV